MATIKSYTDIEQSKKLAEMLPIGSADMCWTKHIENGDIISLHVAINYGIVPVDYPCWSLAALISVLSNIKVCHYNDKYFCQYIGFVDEFPKYSTFEYDNPVDACVEMILKLHELNLL